jgi:4-hydroxy-tetrahydrodipicolinate reductase
MASKPIKIGLSGGAGRMGGMVAREIASLDDLCLVAVIDRGDSPQLGIDMGQLTNSLDTGVLLGSDPKSLFSLSDVVIDFSSPKASMHHAELAAKTGKAIVIGTTGLSNEQEETLLSFAEKTPVVYCANTSVGVTLLTQIVEQVAAQLTTDWDIEILETHHRDKLDAPSGTALALGKAVARGRNVDLDSVSAMSRIGQVSAWRSGDIGFAVLRGGNVAGEHSVIFYSESERIEVTHKANDRVIFARGALRAARFAALASNGLYNMTDVLKG